MAIERRPLVKAPARDVVEAFTTPPAEPAVAPDQVPTPSQTPAATESAPVRRPGAGRPRSKRRMEPFSSKLEIELRDQLDAYVTEHGMTVVDFLDEAIRARLKK